MLYAGAPLRQAAQLRAAPCALLRRRTCAERMESASHHQHRHRGGQLSVSRGSRRSVVTPGERVRTTHSHAGSMRAWRGTAEAPAAALYGPSVVNASDLGSDGAGASGAAG